jgi:hypothetical protein
MSKQDQTTQITNEVGHLLDRQVELLKQPLLQMTERQLHDYEERRDRIRQLVVSLVPRLYPDWA